MHFFFNQQELRSGLFPKVKLRQGQQSLLALPCSSRRCSLSSQELLQNFAFSYQP